MKARLTPIIRLALARALSGSRSLTVVNILAGLAGSKLHEKTLLV